MYRQTVTIAPATPNFPLWPLWVGQGSAAIVILSGVPASAVDAAIILTPVGGGTKLLYAAVKNETTGLMEVYIPGWSFPTVGDARYAVEFTMGTGDQSKTFWSGRGDLHVWEAETNADIPNAPIIPHDTYIRSPVTGLYYLLTVEFNDLGQPVSNYSTEGFANVP